MSDLFQANVTENKFFAFMYEQARHFEGGPLTQKDAADLLRIFGGDDKAKGYTCTATFITAILARAIIHKSSGSIVDQFRQTLTAIGEGDYSVLDQKDEVVIKVLEILDQNSGSVTGAYERFLQVDRHRSLAAALAKQMPQEAKKPGRQRNVKLYTHFRSLDALCDELNIERGMGCNETIDEDPSPRIIIAARSLSLVEDLGLAILANRPELDEDAASKIRARLADLRNMERRAIADTFRKVRSEYNRKCKKLIGGQL